MIWLQAPLLIGGICGGLILAGYWLAAGLRELSPAGRLAVATLAGLLSLLLTVSLASLWVPLQPGWAWLCLLLPCAPSLLGAGRRRALLFDCRQSVRASSGVRWVPLGAGALLIALLWPLLRDGNLVFHDGTSNHDNFFWIAGAEFLQRHTILDTAAPAAVGAPLFTRSAGAIVGWRPPWGRMGAEGFLALLAALTGRPVLEIYHAAVAALLAPWLAGVFLVWRTFVSRSPLGPFLGFATAGLQPLFVFFYANGNLPNLLGVLAAAATVVGTERSLTAGAGSVRAWWGLTALGAHGLLCGYPEMLPFVVLPCGLLCARAGIARGAWRRVAGVVAALAAGGVLLNPATGFRGLIGFVNSLGLARANENWLDLFVPLAPAEYFPALITLAVAACGHLGTGLALALSGVLLGTLAWMLRRAGREAFGIVAILAGAGLLVLYTLATGFTYGWQKSAQFGGIFIAAIFPVGCLTALAGIAVSGAPGWKRWLARTGAAVLLVFFTYATIDECVRNDLWAGRKRITREMLALRAESREGGGAPPTVLVVAESFSRPFFYGMWAAYLFPGSALLHSPRGGAEGVGYLRENARFESPGATPAPAAVFVSRAWAETLDRNAHRIALGADFALLENTNRVLSSRGLAPGEGVPRESAARAEIRLLPHRDAWLHVTLRPQADQPAPVTARVVVENRIENEPEPRRVESEAASAPWKIVLPLRGGVANVITWAVGAAPPGFTGALPLEISEFEIVDAP